MTRPRHFTRTAAAALALALLAGCGDKSAGGKNPLPDVSDGINPNCMDERPVIRYAKFDINGDGTPDWFLVLRCPKDADDKKRGDQLEVLDGTIDPSRPRPLGHHPVIHSGRTLKIYDGCLVFSYQRVLVADKDGKVLRVGTWQKGSVDMKLPSHAEKVPCEETRWFKTG
jgi:hypothetical protein